MKPYFKIAMAATALALACAQPAQATATLGLNAPSVVAAPGEQLTVALSWDLSEAVSLGGLTVNIDWPASGLSFDESSSTALGQSWASFTALFSDPDLSSPLTVTPGHIGGSALFLTPVNLPAGTSTLNLHFTAGAVGTHDIHYDIGLTDQDFNEIHAQGVSSVTVSAVPEPHPALMLLAGLGAVGLIARRRRA